MHGLAAGESVIRRLAFVLGLVLIASAAQAQTADPSKRLGWYQPGQTPAIAQAATYNVYDGASTTPIVLAGVVCTAATPNTACDAAFPALTPGAHVLTMTQVISGAESAKSVSPLSISFVVVVVPFNPFVKD